LRDTVFWLYTFRVIFAHSNAKGDGFDLVPVMPITVIFLALTCRPRPRAGTRRRRDDAECDDSWPIPVRFPLASAAGPARPEAVNTGERDGGKGWSNRRRYALGARQYGF
jgi:hypothetical protein